MAHIQVSTETHALLLQAKDFLVEARRLKPGPARNELREVAKVLREIARTMRNPSRILIGREGRDRSLRLSLPDHPASPYSPTTSVNSVGM